jgi:hypothetical protein
MTAEDLKRRSSELAKRDMDSELSQMHSQWKHMNKTPFPSSSTAMDVQKFPEGKRDQFASATPEEKYCWLYKEFTLILHIRAYCLGDAALSAAMDTALAAIPEDIKTHVLAKLNTDEHQKRSWGATFLALMEISTPFCDEEEKLIMVVNKHLEAEVKCQEDERIVESFMPDLRINHEEQHQARLELAES